jgi:UDP-N-acetylmuramate dehydrogenase
MSAHDTGRRTPAARAPAGMAKVRERVALADYTTLRLGGPARRLVEAATEEQIVAEVRAADESGEPLLVLGGGSNLVVADEGFPGTVVHVATRGVHWNGGRRGTGERGTGEHGTDGRGSDERGSDERGSDERGAGGQSAGGQSAGGQSAGGQAEAGPGAGGNGQDPVELTVAAGEDWDTVVAACVGEGLAGLECLSGIPGRAGATPIQNVGAYGQEVAERIVSVRVYDRDRGTVADLAAADCGFGYRTSAFKRSLQMVPAPGEPAAVTGRFVVLSVRFLLVRSRLSAPVRYAELARALGVAEGDRAPLAAVRSAVLDLRRGKGMVLDPDDPDTRSAGSFFLNPVLDRGHFAAVERAAHAVVGPGTRVPCYPAGDGRVKVSAAWLIEQAGFRKGYRPAEAGARMAGASTDGARISSKHTLALINPGDATAASLLTLAREVRQGVHAAFGVELASEPVLVGASL